MLVAGALVVHKYMGMHTYVLGGRLMVRCAHEQALLRPLPGKYASRGEPP